MNTKPEVRMCINCKHYSESRCTEDGHYIDFLRTFVNRYDCDKWQEKTLYRLLRHDK